MMSLSHLEIIHFEAYEHFISQYAASQQILLPELLHVIVQEYLLPRLIVNEKMQRQFSLYVRLRNSDFTVIKLWLGTISPEQIECLPFTPPNYRRWCKEDVDQLRLWWGQMVDWLDRPLFVQPHPEYWTVYSRDKEVIDTGVRSRIWETQSLKISEDWDEREDRLMLSTKGRCNTVTNSALTLRALAFSAFESRTNTILLRPVGFLRERPEVVVVEFYGLNKS